VSRFHEGKWKASETIANNALRFNPFAAEWRLIKKLKLQHACLKHLRKWDFGPNAEYAAPDGAKNFYPSAFYKDFVPSGAATVPQGRPPQIRAHPGLSDAIPLGLKNAEKVALSVAFGQLIPHNRFQ
jgi:hypothetical protein